MNKIIEITLIIAILATAGIALILLIAWLYKALPFKKWQRQKPRFAWFPKYIANFHIPLQEIETSLLEQKFTKNNDSTYSRGKNSGDLSFSINTVNMTVNIDAEKKQVKVYASFSGIVFDTGDTWQLTHDILNPSPHNG